MVFGEARLAQSIDSQAILGGLLHRIGNFDPVQFELDFNERLIIQKTIYLMQSFGLYIGYNFNWYIRGPYSTALTRDAYKLVDKYNILSEVVFVEKKDEEKFSHFLSFIGDNLNNEDWLECIASIHFLYTKESKKDKEIIYSKILDKMPNLKRSLFNHCWDYLIQYKIIQGEN